MTDIATCPRCGTATSDDTIGGLCAKCLARGAMDGGAGWMALMTTAEPREPPPIIPGWRITRLIGAGGMGRIYHAESDEDGAPAAIKILDARWTHDPVMAARFEVEGDALQKLDHPHIVRMRGTTETADGRLCLIMEHVDGCDLHRLLRAEKLAPARALELFHKVCAAVRHAHEHGFVHRDIKPSNILVGSDGTVKLADFGLVKDITSGGASNIGSLTMTTDQFGTAYYLAPERMAGGGTSGPAGDVFSLGVLLYHLLAGQMPVGKYAALSQLTGLPEQLDIIIAGALESDPAKRTASAAELDQQVAAMWRHHLAGADRALKQKRLITIAAVAALALVTALGGAWWQRAHMPPPAPRVFVAPSAATQETPWENSLGMKFVPVPGTTVLFSIWETRRKDVEPYRDATRAINSEAWRADIKNKEHRRTRISLYNLERAGGDDFIFTWNDLGWPVTPDHPASLVAIRDAQRYSLWLTWKEQAEGRLKPGQRYRLPTHAEWLAACGGEKAALRPGNRAGPEARDEQWPAKWPTLAERDDFPRCAPVGSFAPELHGLHDISGNISEWVSDEDENTADRFLESSAKLRGPAFHDGSPETASFVYLRPTQLTSRVPIAGFRLVLEHQTQDEKTR